MRIFKIRTVLLVAASAIALTSCGLDKNQSRSNKNIISENAAMNKRLDEEAAKIKAYESSEDWSILSSYAKSENWDKKISSVREKVVEQNSTYKSGLKDAKKKGGVNEYLNKEVLDVKKLNLEISSISKRAEDIINAKKNAPKIFSSARTNLSVAKDRLSSVRSSADSSIKSFPERSDEINKRYRAVSDIYVTSESLFSDLMEQEGSENPDFSKIVDTSEALRANNGLVIKKSKEYKDSLLQLPKDYTLMLKDMKAEYKVKLGMSDWSNYHDCCTKDVTFSAKPISASDYEYLSGITAENIADVEGRVYIDKGVWSRIKPSSSAIQSAKNGGDGNFWIEEVSPSFYHKYVEIEGAKASQPKWEEVDEEDYALHLNNFGMAIESKARGQFEDEAITEAIPVGIDKVGNKEYGEWKSDSNGNSFWHYYGQYAFLSSILGNNNAYYRNDYNSYNSWRSSRLSGGGQYGYYGSNRSSPRYGSSGSLTTSTPSYKSSPLKASGGVKAAPRSIKNKSQTMRNRGPRSSGK